jgi:hypothetical protein
MNSLDNLQLSRKPESWRLRDWMAALGLFGATAAVVVWQNLRLAMLWDLSYILENSYRIALGDVPYRDFPLVHAPLTFLTQATLIKLTGRVFFHHAVYCAVVGGLATVITWRMLLRLLRQISNLAWTVALLLSLPLTLLGIYSIFPHPFYDPDCTFAILLCLGLLLRLEPGSPARLRPFLTGSFLVIPLFVKQNTGLAFLASTLSVIGMLIGLEKWRSRSVSSYLWLVAGSGAGLLLALLLVHCTVGLSNYAHWTLEYAVRRRMPPLHEVLAVYRDPLLPWWIVAFLLGTVLLGRMRRARGAMTLLAMALMALPFLWTLIYQFIGEDASLRADALLSLWPLVLVLAAIFTFLRLRRASGLPVVLALPVIGTVHGAFLSQQLWGSSYGLWPLLALLLASVLIGLAQLNPASSRSTLPLTIIISVAMMVSGGFYIVDHERLNYAKLSGKVIRSRLAPLAGLSIPGPWISQFEELVRFTDSEINRQDALLVIPGEDLFYYTTGRHPRFPVAAFDYTVNPYTAEQIFELSRVHKVAWLVVKRTVQLDPDPLEDRQRLLSLLQQDFKQVKTLANYDIYQRKAAPP